MNDIVPDKDYFKKGDDTYRPDCIRISDGRFASHFEGAVNDDCGVRTAADFIGTESIVIFELIKIESIPKAGNFHGTPTYDFDTLADAYEEYKPPVDSIRIHNVYREHENIRQFLKVALSKDRIEPIHRIGSIKYYNREDVKTLCAELYNEKREAKRGTVSNGGN